LIALGCEGSGDFTTCNFRLTEKGKLKNMKPPERKKTKLKVDSFLKLSQASIRRCFELNPRFLK
jgi:hypothetical protein